MNLRCHAKLINKDFNCQECSVWSITCSRNNGDSFGTLLLDVGLQTKAELTLGKSGDPNLQVPINEA